MGRTCRVCGRSRPNEHFGGRGARAYACRKCRRLPKQERRRILATNEVYGFLRQKNISAKNIKRLEQFGSVQDSEFQRLRALVLSVAQIHPRKRRRWRNLQQSSPDLYQRIIESELFDFLHDHYTCSEWQWIEEAMEIACYDLPPDDLWFDPEDYVVEPEGYRFESSDYCVEDEAPPFEDGNP